MSTTRRTFLAGSFAALAAPVAAEAQQAGKVYRVGILTTVAAEQVTGPIPPHPHVRVFMQRFAELGWIYGRTVVTELRGADGRLDRLPALADELVRVGVDLIVTAGGNPAVLAAKRATSEIPIVMATSCDSSRRRARVEPLPAGRQHYRHESRCRTRDLCEATWLAQGDGHQHHSGRGHLAERRAGAALAYGATRGSRENARQLGAGNSRNRRRLLCCLQWFGASAGRRTSSVRGVDVEAACRRAAEYADRVLRGTKPGDLPVEQPSKFELVINVKTAKALGLTIPPSLLLRADQGIE